MYVRLGFKRLIDIFGTLLTMVVLSPLLLILALLVRTKLGSPILFSQDRVGKDNKIFRLYKFRTMTSDTDEHGNLLPDAQRLTKFGRFLRSTSLDELPELWNILRGDMAIIGPRPLLVSYLPLYSPEQARRHLVRPGLTGYAQVNGRNSISWAEKFQLDCWYIDNLTFLLDVKVVLTTVYMVLARRGISSELSATMEPFTGDVQEEGTRPPTS